MAETRRLGVGQEDPVFAKCVRRLLPFAVLLFTVNFLDRVNVGFAALTMNEDLGFSPATYGFAAGIFFAGYFACQLPSNVILARVGARRWIFFIVAVWGAISAACAFIQDAPTFYVFRFLLGAAEAGFFPGMLYYFTLWFPHSYRARLAGALIAANPFANVIGGPLSSLILGLDGVFGFRGWQWLFLIEGAPAVILAFAVLKIMPDGPEQAAWLTTDEKKKIAMTLANEPAPEKRDLWQALSDPRVFAISLVAFGIQSSLFGINLWLPQMVQGMGFSAIAAGFVVVPPYAASALAMILWGRASDRRGERIWHVALPALLGAIGLIAASALHSVPLVLIALTIAVIGTQSTFGPFWGLPSRFLGSMAAAGGIAIINSIGSLGGFFAPTVIGILRENSGDYASSMIVLALALLSSATVVLVLGRTTALGHARYSD